MRVPRKIREVIGLSLLTTHFLPMDRKYHRPLEVTGMGGADPPSGRP
jgi:hypothetical protein